MDFLNLVREIRGVVEPQVYQRQYPAIRFRSFLPRKGEGMPPTVPTIYYMNADVTGEADWYDAPGSDDIPVVGETLEQRSTTVRGMALGYRFNTDEVAEYARTGIAIESTRAATAREIYERTVEDKILNGDARAGISGFLNHPDLHTYDQVHDADDGDAGSPLWSMKTWDEVLLDINTMLGGIEDDSLEVEMADTLLLPTKAFRALAGKFLTNTAVTLLSIIREQNVYTMETGNPLNIQPIRKLNTAAKTSAGADKTNTGRAIALYSSEDVVAFYEPMPFNFFSLLQRGHITWEVGGRGRFSGSVIYRPKAIRTLDQISA